MKNFFDFLLFLLLTFGCVRSNIKSSKTNQGFLGCFFTVLEKGEAYVRGILFDLSTAQTD